jgi:predicted GNAT superfamily acetyltransferase
MAGQGPAWELVRTAAHRSGVSIVPLEELNDADRVRAVIEAVWGEQDLPREMLRAFQHAGSVLFGAEANGELVGFVMGFAGLADGLHVHSHMLAAVPGWQDRGIGYVLKLAQRAECLDRGIDEVRWTFDPLVARNARFNLVKLGAEAFRLLPDFYGEMSDRLNRGDRSDRFDVRWRLSSDRVEQALRGTLDRVVPGESVLEAVGETATDDSEPKLTGVSPAPGARVAIPADHQGIKARDPALARRWREASAEAFRVCFDEGLVATWFDRDAGYVFAEPSR